MINYCLIDFEHILSEGFKIRNVEVKSPKLIQTAAIQMAKLLQTLLLVTTMNIVLVE